MPDEDGTPRRALATEPEEQTQASASGGRQRPTVRSILRDSLRPSRGQLVLAIILGLTALLVVTTIRSRAAEPDYANLRRADLIQLLDNLAAETRRLETEVRDLNTTRDQLASGAQGAEAARAESQKRLSQLQIIAGTVPARGPGVRIVIEDPEHKVGPEILLNALEELRDAGAEVIEFNDQVRVVGDTWLAADGQGRILASGTVVNPGGGPIIIEAIGNAATLEAGAQFRGGLVSEIEGARIGGKVAITRLSEVTVASVVAPGENQFARPR